MKPVLQITRLTKRFGEFTAVDALDLEIGEGRFYSILGPSGCGKTTLLRMIAGFLTPDEGEVRISGNDMALVPPHRRPVNLVFQSLALFPMMNVEENIGFGLRRRKLRSSAIKSKVESILERVELAGFGRKKIDQLSGGQKQRVAIARALVLEPSLLLLDEPLGALDLKLREQMKIELKQLQAEVGTTFLYITHDQSEALMMSDTVAVMNCGRFEQLDSPQDLYLRPASRFVANFVGDTNIIAGQLSEEEQLVFHGTGGEQFKAVPGEVLTGGDVDLFIRPEAVILGSDNVGEDMNQLILVVDSVLFDGSNTRLLARLEKHGTKIRVALPLDHRFDDLQPGKRFQAAVHRENCRLYNKEEL